MTFEQQIQNSMFQEPSERTYIDKVLAKKDVDRIRDLMKKACLTREELLELLYLCVGTEAKLVNYNDWDRYVMNKLFVWIREFIKIAETIYDYKENLEKAEKDGKVLLTKRSTRLLENQIRLIEHNAKFLIDIYFNLARTTLSRGATGFLETLKSKFEFAYPNQPLGTPIQGDQKRGLLGFRSRQKSE